MPAKDYVPFAILGFLLAPAAFMLLFTFKSFEKVILILLLASAAIPLITVKEKGTGFVIKASIVTFLSSSLILALILAMIVSSFRPGT